MNATTTLDRVKALFAEHLGVKADEVTPESTVVSLGGDSLDQAELMFGVEDEFDLEISDADAEGLTTVAQVVSYVDGRKQAMRA